MRLVFAFAALSASLLAQSGTTLRPKPSDYPVMAKGEGYTLAGEYMVRSFGQHNEMFTTDDYLVVEIAVFADKGRSLTVKLDQFRLKVNGKEGLHPQIPQIVAGSLRYPDWDIRRGPQAEVGVGPVILGRRQPEPRFPGDPGGARRYPGPAPRPEHEGAGAKETKPADVAVVEYSLPEGLVNTGMSGYIYFAYRGKPSKIKKLELVHQVEGGSPVNLKLL